MLIFFIHNEIKIHCTTHMMNVDFMYKLVINLKFINEVFSFYFPQIWIFFCFLVHVTLCNLTWKMGALGFFLMGR
jgi:hypothetical protein